MPDSPEQIQQAVQSLSSRASQAAPAWPHTDLRVVGAAGAWRSIVPRRWGGDELAYSDLLRTYTVIAKHSVALALILTQRDSACDLIARGENPSLKDVLLPAYATGERFTTVGIAQLTTSKGARGPKVRARRDGDALVLSGTVPWATGAAHSDEIVVGGVMDDGAQLLASVPRDAAGITVQPPMQLLALTETVTSSIVLEDVRVTPDRLFRGPCEQALDRRAPVKGLTVSAVGVGLAAAIYDAIAEQMDRQAPEIAEAISPLHDEYNATRDAFFAAAVQIKDAAAPAEAPEIRVRVNALLTRLAITLLNISKGGGFVSGRPAERLLREAMFFHVWSLPAAVQAGTLRRLLGTGGS